MTNAGFTVVEGSQLLRVLGELGLQQSSLFDDATSKAVGKQLGALVHPPGRAVKLKPETNLSLRLVDVESGKIVLASSIKPASYDHAISISKALSGPIGVKKNLPGGDVGGDGAMPKSKEIESNAKSDAAEFLRKYNGAPKGYDATVALRILQVQRKADDDGKGDIWSNNVISYECFGSNKWKETGKTFTHWFTEIDRTPNYVELARAVENLRGRYVVLRIYEDRVGIKQAPDPTFSEAYRGSWTKRGDKASD